MNVMRMGPTLEALVRSLVHSLIIAVWYVIAYKIGSWLFGKTGGWWMAWGVVWLNLFVCPHRHMVKEKREREMEDKRGRWTNPYISPLGLMQHLRVSGAICPNSLELQDIDSRTPCS